MALAKELSEAYVGHWARRKKRGQISSRPAHLIQSIIEDRVVTKCGRQMRTVNSNGELYVSAEEPMYAAKCLQCHNARS